MLFQIYVESFLIPRPPWLTGRALRAIKEQIINFIDAAL